MELEEIKQIRPPKKFLYLRKWNLLASRKLIKLFQTFYPPTPLAGQHPAF